jgi:hypothetical protein
MKQIGKRYAIESAVTGLRCRWLEHLFGEGNGGLAITYSCDDTSYPSYFEALMTITRSVQNRWAWLDRHNLDVPKPHLFDHRSYFRIVEVSE